MLKGKKVLIFDTDGTLIESVGVWNQVDCELIRQLGNVMVSEEEVQKQRDDNLREYSKAESPYLEYCRYLGSKYGSELTAEEIHTLRYDIANDFLVRVVDYKPHAEAVIELLKDKGFQLVIATTTRKKNLDIYRYKNVNIRSKAPIDDYFSPIYSREDVKEIKPNPEVYLKVMETLDVKPEECLIFEDSLIGIEAACNAGIEAVAMYDKYSDGEREEINKRAKYCFGDYTELKEALGNC